MSKKSPYPFVKWAGGKARVAGRVLVRLPDQIETYYEPFLGGGAIFFELARAKRFKKAVIGDSNAELMTTWKVIRDSLPELIRELRKSKYVYEKQAYLAIRKLDPEKLDSIKVAARFIYLNRTGFNGLYRVNLDGKFNTPFGKYTNPLICDQKNLEAVSAVLQENVELCTDSFQNICLKAKHGDAVYFDPPYIPVSKTSKFTSYTANGFTLEQHELLAKVFTDLGEDGVRTVLSNSVAEDALRLYSRFDMDTFTGTRSVGGPADYRKPAGEIIAFTGPKS